MVKTKRDPLYWNSDKPPLLIQGFAIQVTSIAFAILVDRKTFQTKVNRGIVSFIDYQTTSLDQWANGLIEADFNASTIDCVAGGQEILVNEPAERYNYVLDLGDKKEHKIPVIINGGQSITSTLQLPDLTSSLGANPLYTAQLLLHYSTRKHEEWVKKYSHFGSGLGLKRRSYRLNIPAGSPTDVYRLDDVIPKNQGKVIGFSFLTETDNPTGLFINFSVDDLGLVENVCSFRWSRLNQRDPYIMWVDLNPGSTFELAVNKNGGSAQTENVYVTFYFDN